MSSVQYLRFFSKKKKLLAASPRSLRISECASPRRPARTTFRSARTARGLAPAVFPPPRSMTPAPTARSPHDAASHLPIREERKPKPKPKQRRWNLLVFDPRVAHRPETGPHRPAPETGPRRTAPPPACEWGPPLDSCRGRCAQWRRTTSGAPLRVDRLHCAQQRHDRFRFRCLGGLLDAHRRFRPVHRSPSTLDFGQTGLLL
mmetsp:Transcript_17985/g.44904  ORF Transcript_17985/g.44904 Transcript_17985/m.44904 type:complete len:203 (+) Transcript_17985:980-1588(+)